MKHPFTQAASAGGRRGGQAGRVQDPRHEVRRRMRVARAGDVRRRRVHVGLRGHVLGGGRGGGLHAARAVAHGQGVRRGRRRRTGHAREQGGRHGTGGGHATRDSRRMHLSTGPHGRQIRCLLRLRQNVAIARHLIKR